jgi:hemoglobin
MTSMSIRFTVLACLALLATSLRAQAQAHPQQHAELPTYASPAPERDPAAPDPAPVHPELAGVFEEFGGMEGMTALMEDFMAIMLKDPRTRPFFEHADQARIKRQLAEQFCAILDGGCSYSGRDMKTSHANHSIAEGDFNALVEDLQLAMNQHRIPFRAQNKLLGVLATMHREVINR